MAVGLEGVTIIDTREKVWGVGGRVGGCGAGDELLWGRWSVCGVGWGGWGAGGQSRCYGVGGWDGKAMGLDIRLGGGGLWGRIGAVG